MRTRYLILSMCSFILQQFSSAQTLYTPKGSVFFGEQHAELTADERNAILAQVRAYSEATRKRPIRSVYSAGKAIW